ncbi:MAG: bifunctional DNA-formamidopyrimidine glycosylase/DNA-(apurinic or apyrimidinic site) lyase [Pseudomonadota bacterium]
MPELPEVETTVRALRPRLEGRRIARLVVRDRRLRWPVPASLAARLSGVPVLRVVRRAKYILVETGEGTLIIHLGMSGSLRILPAEQAPGKHDHVDIVTDHGDIIRYCDPRRFGCLLWQPGEAARHALLRDLGPEPWDPGCTGDSLFERSRGRRSPVKTFLMDSGIIVGVGNIYANEALFDAGIRPGRAAGRVTREEYGRLLAAVRAVLEAAIRAGGTTLRDFVSGDARPGYFQVDLKVYGRGGLPCPGCGGLLKEVRISNRSTVYCPSCQR